MEAIVERVLFEAMERLRADGKIPAEVRPSVVIERPKRDEFGDFGCALPLALGKATRRNPAECGKELMAAIQAPEGLFQAVTFAPPGYLNFKVAPAAWFERMRDVTTLPASGAGERVLLEFVSANPTGPLHVGHGRGAVLGDSVARLMRATGYAVETEYYVNDVGNQMAMMGLSLHCRGREILGSSDGSDFPENGYRGQYVRDVAAEFVATEAGRAACLKAYEDLGARDDNPCTHFAEERLLAVIRGTLRSGDIEFDHWTNERSLYASGAVERTTDILLQRDNAYRDEAGSILFRMEGKADEDDRVMVRASGVPTYFAADIAYHDDKARRGFTRLINIWGADHHGYIPRMKASLEAMGHNPAMLQVLLVQMVTLTRGGVAVPMGKRSGEFVTLQEVLDEVGRDAVRFLFLLRKADAQMEFDLDLAKSQTMDNPVYYVQYGHARVASILRKAAGLGIAVPGFSEALRESLTLPEEQSLI
jgi:arginyl-tRNA synthetase